MDMQMPVMDGLTATRMIMHDAEALNRARPLVVAVTANVYAEDKKNCREAGMCAFIEKPIRMDALQATLDECLAALPAVAGADAPRVDASGSQASPSVVGETV
jgi:CheY-like chemotaxis protein